MRPNAPKRKNVEILHQARGALGTLGMFTLLSAGCSEDSAIHTVTQEVVTDNSAQPDNPGGTNATRIYYVKAVGGDDDNHNGLDSDHPFKTIRKAIQVVTAGDTVLVMNGDYKGKESDPNNDWDLRNRHGNVNNYITFKNFPGHNPRLITASLNGFQIANSSYIEFQGFEITGLASPNNPNSAVDFDDEPVNSPWRRTVSNDPKYSNRGVTVMEDSHHVRITNNKIHGVGDNGIALSDTDVILIEGNEVYNSTHRSSASNSGISVLRGKTISGVSRANYGIVVRNNIVHHNVNMVYSGGFSYIVDGNGVIADYHNYAGRTLIANNVIFQNGGRCVHTFQSAKVDAINNTCWRNLTSPTFAPHGELTAQTSADVHFINNIAIATAGEHAYHAETLTGAVSFKNNLLSGAIRTGIPGTVSDNQFAANAKFKNATTNAATADFSILEDSPAKDIGINFAHVTVDILGQNRPSGDYDAGAYEFVGMAVNPCENGVLDGDETDVDCGGSCPMDCNNGEMCQDADDCLSDYCDGTTCDDPPVGGSVYVSDLTAVLSKNGWGPVEKDQSNGEKPSNDGQTMSINGQTCSKGLGVHAQSEVVYQLGGNGTYTSFDADVGVDDEKTNPGSVRFIVKLDGSPVYSSDVIVSGQNAIPVHIDIPENGNTLSLIVNDGGNGTANDHADWCNARLTLRGTEPPSCDNDQLDGDETDVDCGGSCPTQCADGQMCTNDGDCQSGLCDGFVCSTPGPTVLFFDDFNDGNANGWNIVAGDWSVAGGRLLQTSTSGSRDMLAFAGSGTWTDYTVSLKFELTASQVSGGGVVLRRQSNSRYYFYQLDTVNDQLVFWKITSGGWVRIGHVDKPLSLQEYDLVISANGPNFTATIDGQNGGSFSDSNSPYLNGSIGLRTWRAAIAVDDVQVVAN